MPAKTVASFRLGEEKLNNQGCLMKVAEYNTCNDILIEFQDSYKCKLHTTYQHFKDGSVKNPYYPTIYGIGIVGNKYLRYKDYKPLKEYTTWSGVLRRCFDSVESTKYPTYQDATCCNEWLLYENFYEWLHNQENFDKWLNGRMWCLDKDILIKHNKVYSPETCCLVPNNVNTLFVKCDAARGDLPIGVSYNKINHKYISEYSGRNTRNHIGCYDTSIEAFYAYKKEKEAYIKQVAQEEYDKGNITKKCYDAMMAYEVEATD